LIETTSDPEVAGLSATIVENHGVLYETAAEFWKIYCPSSGRHHLRAVYDTILHMYHWGLMVFTDGKSSKPRHPAYAQSIGKLFRFASFQLQTSVV
jgi:hypothetical protein